MNKYLYERIAPIWLASPAKLHWDNCNLHFVYSKKRKSEICAFCCFYFIYFFGLRRAVLSAGSSTFSLFLVRHSLEWEYIFVILFHVLMQCAFYYRFISLFFLFFGYSLQWKIFMCYCANWIQLAYSQSVDFAWAQLKPHLNEVLISLPIKSLEKKNVERENAYKRQIQRKAKTKTDWYFCFYYFYRGEREKIRWLKTGKNQIDREKKEKLRHHAKSIMRWRLLLFLCWARNFTAL